MDTTKHTPAPREEILRLAAYYTPREMAPLLGITAGSVRRRLQSLGLGRGARVQVLRPCLCCSRDFAPEHKHNRLCPGCAEGTGDYEVRV